MHILCIRYGTVLANAAVLCMCVCIVCLPVYGAPWWVLLQHSNYVANIFHRRVWYHTLSLHSACPHPVGYICVKFCFFRGLYGKNCVLTHSTSLFDAPGTKALVLQNNTTTLTISATLLKLTLIFTCNDCHLKINKHSVTVLPWASLLDNEPSESFFCAFFFGFPSDTDRYNQ